MRVLLDMAATEAAILDDACEHEDEGEACEGPERDQVAELCHTVVSKGGDAWIGDECSQLLGIAEDGEGLVEDFIEEGVRNDEGWIWAVRLGLYEEEKE